MDNRGPFSFWGVPDDAEGPDEEDVVHRGWIAPEDRLWRHPSEVSRLEQVLAPATVGCRPTRDRWRERRGAIAAGTLGATAVAATAVIVLTLANAPATTNAIRPPLQFTDTSLVTMPSLSVSAISGIAQLASSLSPSLVKLRPAGTTGRPPMTGVVLPGGQFVVTAASATAGVEQVQIVTSRGAHLRGRVVATDKYSGVAVVSTSRDLKPASFADEDVVPGELAVTACLCSGTMSLSVQAEDMAVGRIQEVGREVSSTKGVSLMDAIEAETPLRADWGEVLLDGHGNVIGILDGQESADNGTVGLFVPASLALGVADELARDHRVEHGWIGVSAQDAPGDAGAMVSSVFPSSPAAGAGIEPGDVVTTIDTHNVSSHADLQARLYTMPPGSTVTLTVERSGTTRTVSVDLASDPGG